MSSFNRLLLGFFASIKPQNPISEYKIRVRERAPHHNQFGAGVNSSSDRALQRDNNKEIIKIKITKIYI